METMREEGVVSTQGYRAGDTEESVGPVQP